MLSRLKGTEIHIDMISGEKYEFEGLLTVTENSEYVGVLSLEQNVSHFFYKTQLAHFSIKNLEVIEK